MPYDSEWISKRINATSAVDLDALAHAGFILLEQPLQGVEQDASAPLAKCLSRGEERRDRGETEESRERGAKRATRAPKDWQPDPQTLKALVDEHPGTDVDAEVAKYRDWSVSATKGAKVDHNAAFRNWVRRATPSLRVVESATMKSARVLHEL